MIYMDFNSMPLVLSVYDVADTLSIGRNKAYALVKSGEIQALRVGNSFRIPRDAFIEFLRNPNEPT